MDSLVSIESSDLIVSLREDLSARPKSITYFISLELFLHVEKKNVGKKGLISFKQYYIALIGASNAIKCRIFCTK